MNIQSRPITDELPNETSLKGGEYRITGVHRSTRNSLNYAGATSSGGTVEIKEFYLRDLCKRSELQIQPRDPKDARLLSGLVRSFARDAAFLTTLDSPAVANVQEVFEENGTAYMVSARPGGVPLVDAMADPDVTFSPEEIMRIADDLANALVEIHGFGMLHRDITPANIVLTDEKRAILLPDFGTFREDRSKVSKVVSSVLQSTQDYAPFELAFEDKRQGDGSDIYSMAAVIYHLITGAPPAPSLERLAAVAEQKPDPYTPVEGNADGFETRFLKVVDLALELFLESRVNSATEFMLVSSGMPDILKTQALKMDVAERSAPLLERSWIAKLRRIFFGS